MKTFTQVYLKGTVSKKMMYTTSPKQNVVFVCALTLIHEPTVVLKFKTSWFLRQQKVHEIYDGLLADVHDFFTVGPTDPTLPNYLLLVKEFDGTMTDVANKVPNAAANRKVVWKKLKKATENLRVYVQKIVDNDLENALMIVGDAHMELKDFNPRGKNVFAAYSERTGQVELQGVTKAKRQCIEWEQSTNPNDPKLWNVNRIPPTLAAETMVECPSDTDVYFRSRVITKDGPGEWSPVIKVHVK